ncbi:MAG TPA: methylated-DNA--[protein]-cysteine S-methyltransferase [Edaphobacter sp.]|nr:methylated-DNA--[protein]-cysteine S-methyltransferase [Edaphobacter sp.]
MKDFAYAYMTIGWRSSWHQVRREIQRRNKQTAEPIVEGDFVSAKEHFLMESPLGTLTLVNTEGILSGLYLPDHKHGPKSESLGARTRLGFEQTVSELQEYFDRKRTLFTLPLAPTGTSFQQSIWRLLRDIPYGETRTYAQLADAIGNRAAIRAVGLANGRNPISIVVPCHRVIGSDGGLTGYAGGLNRKRFLLDLEGAAQSRQLELI